MQQKTIKSYIKESRSQEVDTVLNSTIEDLSAEGLHVEFGNIGKRTTYALIYSDNTETEIVGYTYLKDLRFYNEKVGKLKALQQAIARKNLSDSLKED